MTGRVGDSGRLRLLLLLLVLSIAAFLQFTVVSRTVVDGPLRADAGQYFSYAYNLRNHGTFSLAPTWQAGNERLAVHPDSLRAPGYPLFLALLGNPEPTDAYLRRVGLVQAALGVLSILLVYLIASSLLGQSWALVPALATALSPHLAMMNTYLLTESLFFFLLMASVFSLVKAVQSSKKWPWILTGVLWGATSMVKPTTLLFPLALFAATMLLPGWRSMRRPASLAILAFGLVVTPWALRNQSSLVQKPDSLMVLTLAHGSYPDFKYQGRAETFGFPYRFDPRIGEITRDLPSILNHIAGNIRTQPVTYLQWYLLGKPGYFLAWGNVQGWDILVYPVIHTPYFEDTGFAIVRGLSLLLHWPLILLGLFALLVGMVRPRWLILGRSEATAALLIGAVVAYSIAFHMVVAPFPRYGIPFRPLLFVLAMLPLRAVWLHFRLAKSPSAQGK